MTHRKNQKTSGAISAALIARRARGDDARNYYITPGCRAVYIRTDTDVMKFDGEFIIHELNDRHTINSVINATAAQPGPK